MLLICQMTGMGNKRALTSLLSGKAYSVCSMSSWILGWAGAGGTGGVCVGGISWGSDLGVAVGATCHSALLRQSSAFLCPWAGNSTCVALDPNA